VRKAGFLRRCVLFYIFIFFPFSRYQQYGSGDSPSLGNWLPISCLNGGIPLCLVFARQDGDVKSKNEREVLNIYSVLMGITLLGLNWRPLFGSISPWRSFLFFPFDCSLYFLD